MHGMSFLSLLVFLDPFLDILYSPARQMSLSLRLQHETLNWRRCGGGGDDRATPLLFGGICLQKQKATFKPVVYVAVIPEGEKVWWASSNRGFPKIFSLG